LALGICVLTAAADPFALCSPRGEDAHVFALLDKGADDAIVTKRPWFNLAVEYSEGMVRQRRASS
jgi:hypothetical protein